MASICLISILLSSIIYVSGQEMPPKPITVTVSTLQHLNFGTFIQPGTAGSVTVDFSGVRTPGGDVIIPALSYNAHEIPTPALFAVTALPGTLITIQNGADVLLNGSNSGHLSLKIGPASTGSPFIAQGTTTLVYIGGTLTVGPMSSNPAGSYSGSFSVTFIQQ
jgi:hypothetical protein